MLYAYGHFYFQDIIGQNREHNTDMKLDHISINNIDIPLTNMVIIVGPNGVGKTTFLRDLYYQFINSSASGLSVLGDAKWRVLSGRFLNTTREEWQDWASKLQKISGIQQSNEDAYAVGEYMSHDGRSDFLFATQLHNLRIALDHPELDLDHLEELYGKPFKSQHSYFASVDNRLYLSSNFSGSLTGYSNDLRPAPFLAMNDEILRRINSSLKLLFNKELHVEPHNYPNYTIDVTTAGMGSPKKGPSTTEGLLHNKELYQEWIATTHAGSLSNEEHGVRAATELLYLLENKRKSIIFVDEPELHLYPTTKYNLGKIIARYASKTKQVLVVTHDTDMLRGLVYASPNATILRINSKREIKHISSREIGGSYSSDILQGAFQDSVVIVEGITDKYVYSNALAEKHLADDIALQVVSMEGADRLAMPIPFYENLDIKNAVVADFDTLFKRNKRGARVIIAILKAKGVDRSASDEVDAEIEKVATILYKKPNANKGLGCPSLTDEDKRSISLTLDKLKTHGIFLVPIGSLEDWVGAEHSTPPEKILSTYKSRSKSKYVGLTNFISGVASYQHEK